MITVRKREQAQEIEKYLGCDINKTWTGIGCESRHKKRIFKYVTLYLSYLIEMVSFSNTEKTTTTKKLVGCNAKGRRLDIFSSI